MLVHNLKKLHHVDPTDSLRGAWRSIDLRVIEPGSDAKFPDTAEHAMFVLRGEGVLRVGSETVPVREGSAVTLTAGTGASIRAGKDALELFVLSFA
jgi:mannose-6-phosphate isomerase-like protein (cupin superfamily)